MTALGLVAAGLATWQAVEVWHHGSVFAGWRARVQAWPAGGPWGFLADLLSCPFCLSVWVGVLCAAATTVPPDGWAWSVPVYGLAAARLANLGNDATAGFCRTPRASALSINANETTDEHLPLDGRPPAGP